MTLEFEDKVTSLIRKRISVRSYRKEKIDHGTREKIENVLGEDHDTVFGTHPRFVFIDAGDKSPDQVKKLGTYGMISGARYFIGGIIKKDDAAPGLMDLGYVFEKIILLMTGLGLGTCWLGGTFKKEGFSEKAGLKEGEILSGVTPVGYGLEKRRLKDSAVRMFAGSDRRKPWESLFFRESFKEPLEKIEGYRYRIPLEMVRLGPSASNMQPWRMIIEGDNTFHLYMKNSRFYAKKPDHLNLQYIDMGICMCHFSLTAGELGLRGGWHRWEEAGKDKKKHVPPGTRYIASWKG